MDVPQPHKMTDDQKAMYTGICMSRNTEVTLRWSRSQMFIAINAVGFSFLATQIGKPGIQPYYLILGVAGLSLGFFWLAINLKTQQWIDHWQSCLKTVEPPDKDLLVFRVFSGKSWESINSFPTFHLLLNVLPIAFTGLWIVTLSIPYYEGWIESLSNLFKGGAQ